MKRYSHLTNQALLGNMLRYIPREKMERIYAHSWTLGDQ